MKKIILVIISILIVGLLAIFYVFFHKNTSGPTTEINLRISGQNLNGVFDGFGYGYSPVTWDFDYTDLTTVPLPLWDEDILKKIGTTADSISSYFYSHQNDIVYVLISQKQNSGWYTPDLVTENKDKLLGNLYIKGKINGSLGLGSDGSSIGISYKGIQNSQDLLPLTDLFSVYEKNNDGINAQVLLDKEGNAALQSILVDGKVCATYLKINLNDTECWRDYRSQNSSFKKYSDSKGSWYLFFNKVYGYR